MRKDREIIFLQQIKGFADRAQIFSGEIKNTFENYIEYLTVFNSSKNDEPCESAQKSLTLSFGNCAMTFNVPDKPDDNALTVRAVSSEDETSTYLQEVKPEKPQAAAEKCQTMSSTSITQITGDEMKYLSKRKDGRWCGRKTIEGRRICVYADTQAACREKLLAAQNVKKREPKRDSFYNFALWWLDTYKKNNITKSTFVNYKYTVNTHLKIKTPINKVTVIELQNLLNALPSTRIREEVYKMIRQIVKKAYELDYIKKDVSMFLQKGKIETSEPRALTVEEQAKMIAALSDDMFSRRLLFYLCTGARPAEIKNVNVNEIRPNYIKINGTKTKNAVRWVKVSTKIAEMVKVQPTDFFNFNAKRFREHLQGFCKKAGVDCDVNIYTLRHTFATNLYIIGVPEKDRQVYMGHTSGSRLTNDVYTTFSPDVKAEDIYKVYKDYYPKF